MSLLQLRSLVTVSEMIRVFFLLSTVFSAVTAKDCFHPDGSRASDHLPCRGDDISNTHCCPLGSACLANGLCLLEEDSSLTTGSCTDKTWDEANCFKTCFAAFGTNKLNSSSTIYRCDGDFWCCSRGNNATSCCSTAKSPFVTKQGSRALIQNGTSFSNGYTLVSIAELEKNSANPQSSAQPVAAINSDSSQPASTPTSTCTAPVATKDTDNEKLKAGLGAGLGVGVPLLVALLISLFLLAWERKVNGELRRDIGTKTGELNGTPSLPKMEQSHYQTYPELSAQEPAATELANSHVGAPI